MKTLTRREAYRISKDFNLPVADIFKQAHYFEKSYYLSELRLRMALEDLGNAIKKVLTPVVQAFKSVISKVWTKFYMWLTQTKKGQFLFKLTKKNNEKNS